ncbi:MAG: hypothetical protein LC539_11495, partial [Candidatus Thiodiazotropha sp.]|nr:hypothetical protein [Candidatus Thiodiazotropha sp.]
MFIKSLAFFTALSFTTSVTAIQNLVLDPNPQSTSNTCQSYSIAFTLAQSGLWHTEVTTPKQLRALEQNIRKEINQYVAERQADGKSISTYHHTAWAAAVKRASSNNLKLKLYYPNNPDDYYKKIAQITNMTSASTMGSALSALLVKQPIMTSVNQLNNDIY